MATLNPVISVFGSSQVDGSSQAYQEALEAGALLAKAGFAVCSGGYAGVMEAVSRGAREAGGFVLGVTTDVFATGRANRWLSREIRTATLLERLQSMVQMGSGYLALKGGIGTLTEVSLVWSLLQTRSFEGRPLVLLREPWQGLLDFCTDRLINRADDFGHVHLADSVADAVRMLSTELDARVIGQASPPRLP